MLFSSVCCLAQREFTFFLPVYILFIYFGWFFFTFLHFVSGWLKDTDHELIRRVSLRIEDVTGLTMDTAEELQVCAAYYVELNLGTIAIISKMLPLGYSSQVKHTDVIGKNNF